MNSKGVGGGGGLVSKRERSGLMTTPGSQYCQPSKEGDKRN